MSARPTPRPATAVPLIAPSTCSTWLAASSSACACRATSPTPRRVRTVSTAGRILPGAAWQWGRRPTTAAPLTSPRRLIGHRHFFAHLLRHVRQVRPYRAPLHPCRAEGPLPACPLLKCGPRHCFTRRRICVLMRSPPPTLPCAPHPKSPLPGPRPHLTSNVQNPPARTAPQNRPQNLAKTPSAGVLHTPRKRHPPHLQSGRHGAVEDLRGRQGAGRERAGPGFAHGPRRRAGRQRGDRGQGRAAHLAGWVAGQTRARRRRPCSGARPRGPLLQRLGRRPQTEHYCHTPRRRRPPRPAIIRQLSRTPPISLFFSSTAGAWRRPSTSPK